MNKEQLELKRIGAIDLPVTTQEEVGKKILMLKALTIEVEDKYKDILKEYKRIQAQKKDIITKIDKAMDDTKEVAITNQYDGVIETTKTSYNYDLPAIMEDEDVDKFSKRVIDKVALKNYVKNVRPVNGFSISKEKNTKLDVEKLLLTLEDKKGEI